MYHLLILLLIQVVEASTKAPITPVPPTNTIAPLDTSTTTLSRCCICLGDLKLRGSLFQCRHNEYHEKCMRDWIESSGKNICLYCQCHGPAEVNAVNQLDDGLLFDRNILWVVSISAFIAILGLNSVGLVLNETLTNLLTFGCFALWILLVLPD
jgi:hypothetical protein